MTRSRSSNSSSSHSSWYSLPNSNFSYNSHLFSLDSSNNLHNLSSPSRRSSFSRRSISSRSSLLSSRHSHRSLSSSSEDFETHSRCSSHNSYRRGQPPILLDPFSLASERRDWDRFDRNNNFRPTRNLNLTEEEQALVPMSPEYRPTTPNTPPLVRPAQDFNLTTRPPSSSSSQASHRSCLGCVLRCETDLLKYCLGCKLHCPHHQYRYERNPVPRYEPTYRSIGRAGQVPLEDPFRRRIGREFQTFNQIQAHIRKQTQPRQILTLPQLQELTPTFRCTRTSTPPHLAHPGLPCPGRVPPALPPLQEEPELSPNPDLS